MPSNRMGAGHNSFLGSLLRFTSTGHAVTELHARGGKLDGVSESYDLRR